MACYKGNKSTPPAWNSRHDQMASSPLWNVHCKLGLLSFSFRKFRRQTTKPSSGRHGPLARQSSCWVLIQERFWHVTSKFSCTSAPRRSTMRTPAPHPLGTAADVPSQSPRKAAAVMPPSVLDPLPRKPARCPAATLLGACTGFASGILRRQQDEGGRMEGDAGRDFRHVTRRAEGGGGRWD